MSEDLLKLQEKIDKENAAKKKAAAEKRIARQLAKIDAAEKAAAKEAAEKAATKEAVEAAAAKEAAEKAAAKEALVIKRKKEIARHLAELDAAAAAKEVNTTYCEEAGCGYIVNDLDCCPFHTMAKITRIKPIMVVVKIHTTEVMPKPTRRHVLTEDEKQEIIDTKNAKLIKTVKCNMCLLANCNCPQKLPSGKSKKKVSFAYGTK